MIDALDGKDSFPGGVRPFSGIETVVQLCGPSLNINNLDVLKC